MDRDGNPDDRRGRRPQRLLEVVGGLALFQGVLGIVRACTGWSGWGPVGFVGLLDGREVYGSIALVVLAIALFAAAEGRRSR
ncbi:hypothetical protein V2W30_31975 [Streptomyces sp. Q6]|uniref:Uncharacterized protein n=1 Tax=Streptomyces citrinus TaxID=3118173 RepID=A0ACD5AKB5_9ACTN